MKVGIYFTLGDFGLQTSAKILIEAAKAGASLLEIGLPFSDPLLDGPVIQQSHSRAMRESGVTFENVAKVIAEIKEQTGTPISIMTSFQLLYSQQRADLLPAVEGTLVTDISWKERVPLSLSGKRVWFLSQDVALSDEFCAPPEDISMVYLTRVQGVTGIHQRSESTTAQAIARIRQVTQKPLWLGFGITTPADALEAQSQGADGVVVGSAFVKALAAEHARLESASDTTKSNQLASFAGRWVSEFVKAL